MAQTTFTGPVTSLNGFSTGTSSVPVVVTSAGNISSSYGTTSAATGDTRLAYDKLTFTSTGSGETVRAFSVVTGASAATAGTINGAHISMEVDTGGSISGAGNAVRATLGGTALAPGGTLAVIQADTNFASGVSLPATSSFIRVTDSGAGAGKVANLFNIASGTGLLTTGTTGAVAGGIKIRVGSTSYYLLVSTSIS